MDVVEVDIMLVSAGAGDDEIDVGEGCGVDGVAGKLGTASASAIEGSCRVPFPMKSRIGAGANASSLLGPPPYPTRVGCPRDRFCLCKPA